MKTYFDEAIGVVPPSPIDLDALITRRRRRTVYRNIALTATALVAVAAGLALTTGGNPNPSPDPRPADPGPATPSPDKAAALTEKVRAGVVRQAPGLSWVEPYDAQTLPANGFSSDVFHSDAAVLRDADGPGSLYVALHGPDPLTAVPPSTSLNYNCQADEGPRCAVSSGPAGERIVRRTTVFGAGHEQAHVAITRTDGTLVVLTATNYVRDATTGPVTRPAPVLTLDQLTAIGLGIWR